MTRIRLSLIFIMISFSIAWPAFFIARPQFPTALQFVLLILGSYAPAIGAWVALAIEGNADKASSFRHRLRIWRASPWLYILAVLTPTLFWLLSMILASPQRGMSPIAWTSLLIFPVIFVTNWGEEVGWRGFALPRLIESLQPLTASLLLGLIWGCFHIPLYWQRPLFAVLFLVLTPAISIFITWLFIASGESVLIVALFHAAFNTMAQAILPTRDAELLLAISAGLMWLIAALLIVRYGSRLYGAPGGR